MPYVHRYKGIKHFTADDKNISLLNISYVPNRIIIDKSGKVVEWFDGTAGKVVGIYLPIFSYIYI